MKKTILTISFIFVALILNAQKDKLTYKQNSQDKNLEMLFDPGAIFNSSNGNNIFSNGIGIRFRLFQTKKLAFRLNTNINYTFSSEVTQEEDNTIDQLELKDKNSSFEVHLKPGIEKHFKGTDRLSPYVGAELNIEIKTSKLKSQYQSGTDVYYQETINQLDDDGFTFGAAIVSGVDYYIVQRFYLGLELSYGINYFRASQTEYKDSAPNTLDVKTKIGKSNTISFQPGTIGVFRIGFLFGGSSSNAISNDDF